MPDDLRFLLDTCLQALRLGFVETARALWPLALAHPRASSIPVEIIEEMERLFQQAKGAG